MELERLITLVKTHENLAEVARATGVSHQHLHKIKRGERRRLQLETLQKLNKYFKVYSIDV